jgi:hypothetical protein
VSVFEAQPRRDYATPCLLPRFTIVASPTEKPGKKIYPSDIRWNIPLSSALILSSRHKPELPMLSLFYGIPLSMMFRCLREHRYRIRYSHSHFFLLTCGHIADARGVVRLSVPRQFGIAMYTHPLPRAAPCRALRPKVDPSNMKEERPQQRWSLTCVLLNGMYGTAE